MKGLFSRHRIVFLLVTVYFLLGILTLTRYGTNWDSYIHLTRGQAYLHYFLTGKRDYSDLPPFVSYFQNPQNLAVSPERKSSRSVYQDDKKTFDFYAEEVEAGHPPISDTLSALFNRILFGQLHLVNDVDAYRVYGVLLAALLVGLVFWWISDLYGPLPGLVASLSLSLYPLFWSESHFNTEKDIPETVFYSFFLYSIWRAFTKKNWKWILVSGIFFGLGLGTKLNILFSPLIIIPWVIFLLIKEKAKLKKNVGLIILGFVAILIGALIFVASWPYLWPNPIQRLLGVLLYYQDIGTDTPVQGKFLGPLGLSWYPLIWVVTTTPIWTLLLLFLGILVSIYQIIIKKNSHVFLFLLWFLVPLARVIWPGASIYGGVRQIMEFLPAMALLVGAGLGQLQSSWLKDKCKHIWGIILILLFLPNLFSLIRMHPYENVYFNPLIGGLPGAKAYQMPYWGFSFGAPYRQAAIWVNQNVPTGSELVFAHELWANIPPIFLKGGITVDNNKRSGYLRKGEYAITLVYQGVGERSYYDEYLDKFLKPVYEVKVDDVTILRIWKNDSYYLKKTLNERILENVVLVKSDTGLRFNLGRPVSLSRLELTYNENRCSPLELAFIRTSKDGKIWSRVLGNLPGDWRVGVLGAQPSKGKLIEPFVGQQARYVDISIVPNDACLLKVKSYKIYYFDE